MARSFADSSVRSFRFVDAPADMSRASALLWPAWIYRIHCPIRTTASVNVIERAVLGLAKCGITDADITAELLGLHHDLIGHIRQQLVERSLIDPRGALSPGGASALESDEQDWSTYTVAHVFQDAFSHHLWPMVFESLPPSLYERWTAGDGEQVQLGTLGSQQWVQALRVVPPLRLASRQPDEHEIMQAVTGRRRAGDSVPSGLLDLRTHRIGTVTAHPEPTFMVTFLTVPLETSAPFIVDDPVGGGASARLQRLVADVAKSDEGLRLRLAELEARHASINADRFTAAREELVRQCRDRVLDRHTAAVMDFDQLFAQLIELEVAVVLVGREHRPEDAKSAFVAAQKVLELVFDDLRRSWPMPVEDRGSFRANKHTWFAYVGGCAAAIGADGPLPEKWNGIRADDMDKAIGPKAKASLRILLIVTILSAAAHPMHPLRSMLVRGARLLGAMDEIADLRNRSAHGNEDAPSPDEVRRAHATVIQVIDSVLGVVSNDEALSEVTAS